MEGGGCLRFKVLLLNGHHNHCHPHAYCRCDRTFVRGWSEISVGSLAGMCSNVQGHQAVQDAAYGKGHGAAVQQLVREATLQVHWDPI